MSKEMKPFNPTAGLPAELASVFDVDALAGDLTDGAGGGGFQVLSIRGSKWRVKSQGEEQVIVNEDDDPIPSIEVVILKANKGVSKIYYNKKYSEGDDEAPTCFSVDGISPDASSTKKQHTNCAACKHNEWGSRMTDAGKKAKACADTRRCAVWLHTPCEGVDETEPMLLRIPAASLSDLHSFGTQMQNKGYPYNALVTRLGFDHNAAYPKLTFKPVRPINEEEAQTVVAMFNSDTTANILNTNVETAEPAAESSSQETVSTEFEQPPEQEEPKVEKPKRKRSTKKAKSDVAARVVADSDAAAAATTPETDGTEQVSAGDDAGDDKGLDADLDSILDDLENLT